MNAQAHALPSFAFSATLCKTCLPGITCWLLPGGLNIPSLLQSEMAMSTISCGGIQERGGVTGAGSQLYSFAALVFLPLGKEAHTTSPSHSPTNP